MEYILKVITVMLWSGFKFVVGFSTAFLFGFNQFEILLYCVGGGMVGVIFYLYLWNIILKVFYHYFPKKQKPVKFSKFKRRLVAFIIKYEVYGVAFLTPVLLSMPIGTVIASSIEPNKWRIKLAMLGALLFWGLVLTGLELLFNIHPHHLF